MALWDKIALNSRVDLSYENIISLNVIEFDINLQTLFLHNNQIKEIGGLSSLTNLQELHLYNNQIKEIGKLSSLSNLHTLYLGNNQIKEIGGLSTLTNLQKLDLSNNEIKEIGRLSSLTNLQVFVLSHNQIKDISGFSSLNNLRELYLGDNEITEIGGLSTLTNLRDIYLHTNQIPNCSLKINKLLKRNREIQWKVVKPQFIRYCFTLAPLNLPVDILIMIYDVNSYPNHLFQKWEIGKTIKDAYQLKMHIKIEI